ncbi:MAG: DNA integrity scanning protein DisA nucleotide-binding domain protein [Acidimicrobiia bacterium]|nr:DNA integrity scanning protein DisA nucleotide-binding domain protein [Acidimicrobiia bacterium]
MESRSDREARHLERLREELLDEEVPLPLDLDGHPLLEEILYARRPPVHEGRVPTYGSIVLPDGDVEGWSRTVSAVRLQELAGTHPDVTRRFADGRAAFTLRCPAGLTALATFERSVEHTASLVELQRRAGGFIVQRHRSGNVRVFTAEAVIEWDTVRWNETPHGWNYVVPVRLAAPQADPEVVRAILDFCVDYLSAGRVGATLVWYLEDPGARPPRMDLAQAVSPPLLPISDRRTHSALRSALAQMDGAAVLAPDGDLRLLGVRLVPSELAEGIVSPLRGTRHTSARRFSFDEKRAVVFVVSADGPVSVFSDGAEVAEMHADPCPLAHPEPDGTVTLIGPSQKTLVCPFCGKVLFGHLATGRVDQPRSVVCPVCSSSITAPEEGFHLRGVMKSLDARV